MLMKIMVWFNTESNILIFMVSHFLCLGELFTLLCLSIADDDLYINDDASSQFSLNSFNSSNINYCSGHEDDCDSSLDGLEELIHPYAMPQKSTRFCPAETLSTANYHQHCRSNKETHRACDIIHHKPRLSRIQSFVDLRSQLLHRSLVEEINKRRLFKTVGSVENIGFQEIQGSMFKS